MQFENIRDAHMYLTGSFLKFWYNNAPDKILYGVVRDVHERFNDDGENHPSMNITLNGNKRSTWISLHDVHIPPQDIKLGNLMFDNQLFYLQRVPVRRAVMGVTSRSLIVNPVSEIPPEFMYPETQTMMLSPEFVKMVQGEYPSIQEAVESRESTAFSRFFSLEPILLNASRVRYRGDIVGEFTNNKFTMYKPFAYVKDILGRELRKQNAEDDYELSVAQ